MITLHIIILTSIFSVMFAYRNYYQIKERSLLYLTAPLSNLQEQVVNIYKAKWHKWQFALQIYLGVIIAFASYAANYSALNSFGHGLLFGATFWLVFDTLLGYLLTGSILHVDKNGIGTIYTKLFGKFDKWTLLISKFLFIGLAILLSNLHK